MPEKFSFTNPNVPLFGPKYQETKANAGKSMEEVRRALAELEEEKNKGKDASVVVGQGDRVTHPQYGRGIVASRSDSDGTVDVDFTNSGLQTISVGELTVIDRVAKDARPSAFAFGYGLALAMDSPLLDRTGHRPPQQFNLIWYRDVGTQYAANGKSEQELLAELSTASTMNRERAVRAYREQKARG